MKMEYEGKPRMFLELMKNMSLMPQEKFIAALQDIPVVELLETNNVHVVSFLENAMVPAISDRGLAIPVVFAQAEDTITYAQSPIFAPYLLYLTIVFLGSEKLKLKMHTFHQGK